jgi:hypothetical protein
VVEDGDFDECIITYGILSMKDWKKWEFRQLVGMYHSGEDYDKILDCLVKIANVVDEMDGVKMPLTKTVIVRICSEYGIETGIADAKKKDVILRIEDILYGKIYPRLGREPDGCKYYREWLKRKLKERTELENLELDRKMEKYAGRQ